MTVMLSVWAIMGMFPFGTKTLMAVDFGQQYISFYGLLKESVLSGDWSAFSYSFTKSLGGPMIGVLAYYLLSPFNIIYILTPLNHFAWAVFLTIWLRYGAIGMSFAYLLIRRYRGSERYPYLVPVFATAYTLSGMLVSYQMNTIFYDAMIMLPLVIVALEELLDGARPFKYIVLLALTMFLQFYMGYMICLFIALYACYYVSPRLMGHQSWKEALTSFAKPLLKTLLYSLLGVLSTAVLLYPVVLNLMESKGQVSTGMTFKWALQINPLDILSKLVIGGFDTTSGWSAGPNLPNIYVGAFALVGFILFFAFAQVSKAKKIAAGLIVFVFFVSFVHEFTSQIWHMGQNPAGFFYRFSWLLSFFMVLLAFQAICETPKLTWKGVGIGLVVIGTSAAYVASQTYTYIASKQPKSATAFVKSHREVIAVVVCLIFFGLAYITWRFLARSRSVKLFFMGLCLFAIPTTITLLNKGYLLTQLSLTIISFGLVLLVFYIGPKRLGYTILALVTIAELGYNAYLSQVTLGYADAYKFSDAAVSVKKVTDAIQKDSSDKFYRIAMTFAYSKTTPSLISYPGLSSFSSSLEGSTIDLFSYMGDVGVNASTQYANGTALTDALYGVRYYVDRKDYTTEEVNANPDKMYFSRMTSRQDIRDNYPSVAYEDDRYIVYENPDVFSLAFATNNVTQSIKFGQNNPVSNQNIILNSMAGTTTKYFELFSLPTAEVENMKETTNAAGQTIYKRIDNTKLGIIRYRVVPKSNYVYYYLTPYLLKQTRGHVSILLNNQWLNNQQSYSQKQLWQLTNNTEGQESVLEFRFDTDDDVNMTGAGLVRANGQAIRDVIKQREQQSMTVTEWTNTSVKGTVDVTDDSNVMMTTIPYSKGWTVTVDGQKVTTKEAWGSLMSFPISSGNHSIEMHYKTPGFWIGFLISVLDVLVIIYLKWQEAIHDWIRFRFGKRLN
ncbi:YfhO family protein [Streptococcus saliviloxodontae]|uniref:Membrane protein YfhO n=2 Tax=Streptococcus saliviloxodontae TaxID=1349416 RepID=A0ABS2PNJ5_9STRE|nr:YfhO family protein [Streptococcus saliviloxodontae]MBM7637013.1 putative membrane protein YfhO [Streptococcus saliviloxodontae]